MAYIDEKISLEGTTRALVTVLRVMLDTLQEQAVAWERLHDAYDQAMAQFDTDPLLAEQRTAFVEVFSRLGLCDKALEGCFAADIRRTGWTPDSASSAHPIEGH